MLCSKEKKTQKKQTFCRAISSQQAPALAGCPACSRCTAGLAALPAVPGPLRTSEGTSAMAHLACRHSCPPRQVRGSAQSWPGRRGARRCAPETAPRRGGTLLPTSSWGSAGIPCTPSRPRRRRGSPASPPSPPGPAAGGGEGGRLLQGVPAQGWEAERGFTPILTPDLYCSPRREYRGVNNPGEPS